MSVSVPPLAQQGREVPSSGIPWSSRLLHAALMRVRPSPVAAFFKHLAGVRRCVVQTPEGVFDLDPVSHIGFEIIYHETYEPDLADALRRYLPPGGTFVDVGANEGYFSVVGARRVGPAGRVLAIEPQTRLRPVMERNLALNGIRNVTIVGTAISDRAGPALLYLTPDTITGSTALAQTTRYGVPTVDITTTTLSRLLEETGVDHVDLLKIDIEGFEYEAVFGSRELFESGSIAAIALELHRSRIEARGLDPDAIVDFLEGCGYEREACVRDTYYAWRWRADASLSR